MQSSFRVHLSIGLPLLLAALLFGLLGCQGTVPPAQAPQAQAPQAQAPTAAAKQPVIGFIIAGPDFYYQCMESGVRKAASEKGYAVVTLNSENKAEKELANMEDMIAKKVDAIILLTANSEASQKAIQRANEANIPVILNGTMAGGPGKATARTYYAFDDMGKAAGEWAVKNLPDGGEIAIVEGLPGIMVAEPITEGFEKAVAANPNLKIVSKQPADFNRQKAMDVSANLLQSFPNLKLIYTHNDDMAMGVIKSIEEAGKSDQIWLISDNANPEGVQAIKDGTLKGSVAQSPAYDGEQDVQLIDDILHGKSVTPEIRIPVYLVTKENLDQAKPWCYQ